MNRLVHKSKLPDDAMEALIFLVAVGILWFISSRRWRRRVINPVAIGLLIYLVATSPIAVALADKGLTFSLPTDSGEPADAIVVLGRGDQFRTRRIEMVTQLWKVKRAPMIFASGMLDARPIVDSLKENGVPAQILSGESCSQTTQENAQFTAAVLGPRGIRKILLVTDPPHMLRSVLLFRSFGFRVSPHPSLLPSYLNSREQMLVILREYLGLAKYGFIGHFQPRSPDEINHPPTDVLNKFSAWNCKI